MPELSLYILEATLFLIILVCRVPKHIHSIWHFLMLMVSKNKFIDITVKDTIKKECVTNAAFRERYNKNDEKWIKEQTDRLKEQFADSAQQLRNSIKQAAYTVFLTLVCAFLLAHILVGMKFASISEIYLIIIQAMSAFFILWAIVGQSGRRIETWNGCTLPENIDKFWYIFLNVIGIFCLFFVQFYNFLK
jgi:hypothetical protein